jgi:thioredoxin 1
MSVLTITKENFEDEVLKSGKPVLIDFWAEWCGPCKMLSPIVDQIAGEVTQKAKVGKVNVDEQPELASQFKVMSIPTLIMIKDGKPVATSVGVKPKEDILAMLNQ